MKYRFDFIDFPKVMSLLRATLYDLELNLLLFHIYLIATVRIKRCAIPSRYGTGMFILITL
jgi:hypothetical protein